MTADIEVICIGNELLIGKVENTNAYWLAQQITGLGGNLRRITVVADTIQEISGAILEAKSRGCDLIITTGGLGPTFDDMTLQGLAAALGQKLIVNAEALEMVKQRCIEYAQKRGMPTEIEMTPPRLKMAIFPEAAQPVINPIGTAPAARATLDASLLFSLPGVPMEMEAIFMQTLAPLIRGMVGEAVFCECSVFVEGIFESRLAPLIDRVMADNVGVYVKSHPMRCDGKPGAELHLTMWAPAGQRPAEVLVKAARELSGLVVVNGGIVQA
ncbi:MAG: molybdopterin-binding protein [Candidatus Bathyarchaeota archaeon]|nr:molybdopterin-binding protein [Candidatus Bathyarchaeota archaeon]